MSASQAAKPKKAVTAEFPEYDYDDPSGAKSRLHEFQLLRQSAGLSEDDEDWLRAAGEVLANQTKALVAKWRAVTAAHPHSAEYPRRPDRRKDPR
jgi:hypothetical protein